MTQQNYSVQKGNGRNDQSETKFIPRVFNVTFNTLTLHCLKFYLEFRIGLAFSILFIHHRFQFQTEQNMKFHQNSFLMQRTFVCFLRKLFKETLWFYEKFFVTLVFLARCWNRKFCSKIEKIIVVIKNRKSLLVWIVLSEKNESSWFKEI